MKKLLILSFLFVSLGVMAQGRHNRPSIADMHARKWQYLSEKAQLTTDQAQKVKPIFDDYEKSLWQLTEKNRDFFRKFRSDTKNGGNPDFAGMNEKFVNDEIMKAKLLRDYYFKLKDILSPEKLFYYFNAERSFRRELIRDWRNRHQPQQGQPQDKPRDKPQGPPQDPPQDPPL